MRLWEVIPTTMHSGRRSGSFFSQESNEENYQQVRRLKDFLKHREPLPRTVDTYGHLIPGANVSFVDRLDYTVEPKAETSWQQSATPRN
jgi:hypothetical protein